MALFNRRGAKAAKETRSAATSLVGLSLFSPGGSFLPPGYHLLTDAPEVAAAVWRIADMMGAMTIHLMRNGKNGDARERSALSRKVDIDPWSCGTRHGWISWIVSTMLTQGEAFVLPVTQGGMILDLPPAPTARTMSRSGGMDYSVLWNGVELDPSEVLHFRLRPDPRYPWKGVGPQVQLQAVVDSILQTAATKQSIMTSDYKPPIIIGVNSDADLSTPELRTAFLENVWKRSDPSEPVVIPSDLVNVTQAHWMSLSDLAIKDGLELDKKAVASVFGVPGFMVGVGSFNRDEYNAFVSGVLLPLAQIIEQELTKKLLINPDLFFRFNPRSLYAYDLRDLASIGDEQYVRGLMTGNEVRDWLGLSPMAGLDELVLLENYIPLDKIGDQKKLQEADNDE